MARTLPPTRRCQVAASLRLHMDDICLDLAESPALDRHGLAYTRQDEKSYRSGHEEDTSCSPRRRDSGRVRTRSAQEKLKVGVIATLSGPPAVLGQQLRNGFNLAVKTLGGKLGGREVEVIVAGRRAQARRRGEQGQGAGRARQGRFRGRPDLLQHPRRDHEARHRRRRDPDQPQCRHLELRRQGVQPELLRHLLPERPGPRGARASMRRTRGSRRPS